MKRLLLLTPLLMAGCTGLVPIAAPPLMSDEECRAEATRARDVRIVSREANFENYANMRQIQSDRNVALREVYDTCMRAHGRAISGGVEPIRRID
ncbi:MAG: hypothetical protein JWR00_3095 [Rubritepida sp.]|nr:hypothetical protein [Rubritepida sp.]